MPVEGTDTPHGQTMYQVQMTSILTLLFRTHHHEAIQVVARIMKRKTFQAAHEIADMLCHMYVPSLADAELKYLGHQGFSFRCGCDI
jgi:hypothetical protein